MEAIIEEFVQRWGVYGVGFLLLILYRKPIINWITNLNSSQRLLEAQVNNFSENNKMFASVLNRFDQLYIETKYQTDILKELLSVIKSLNEETIRHNAYDRGRDRHD